MALMFRRMVARQRARNAGVEPNTLTANSKFSFA
jgi:hypothetical protein